MAEHALLPSRARSSLPWPPRRRRRRRRRCRHRSLASRVSVDTGSRVETPPGSPSRTLMRSQGEYCPNEAARWGFGGRGAAWAGADEAPVFQTTPVLLSSSPLLSLAPSSSSFTHHTTKSFVDAPITSPSQWPSCRTPPSSPAARSGTFRLVCWGGAGERRSLSLRESTPHLLLPRPLPFSKTHSIHTAPRCAATRRRRPRPPPPRPPPSSCRPG